MRAVRMTDEGVRVLDVPAPEGEGVLVTPHTVGICGTDLHLMAMGPRPVTVGHEIGATYEGRPVAIQPFAFCGTCSHCVRGDAHLCDNGRKGLHGVHRDGGMAEQLLVEPACIVELPDGIGAGSASVVEPIAVGVHALDLAGVVAGMRVAVVGAGTIGQVSGVAARVAGASVDIAARHAAQQQCAERLGLHVGVGKGYDVVIDAAGTESSLAASISAVRMGGTVVVPAVYWSDVVLPGLALCLKEVRLVASMLYGVHGGVRETELAARVLAAVPELPDALITHRFPLERAAEAFAVAASREAGAIKVVVDV